MADVTMCVSVNADATYIDDPVHVPRVGDEVKFNIGRRTYEGVVISVLHDFTDDDKQFISVKAR